MQSAGVSWATFEAEAPELAVFVRKRLDARRHRIMATLRADGAPRISGTELLIHGGEVWVGGLPGSRKFLDLRRDPRVSLHSSSEDPPPGDPTGWRGDARLSGIAIHVDDEAGKEAFRAAWGATVGPMPPGPFELIRLAITEVSTVRVAPSGDHLVLHVWRTGEPVRVIERR